MDKNNSELRKELRHLRVARQALPPRPASHVLDAPSAGYVPSAQRRVTGASGVEGGSGRPAARVRLAVPAPSSRETMQALLGSGGEGRELRQGKQTL